MGQAMSDRRLVENQVFFRQPNEKIANGMKELEDIAQEEDQQELIPDTDIKIKFYCECSDENCRKRISIKPSEYRELHQNSNQFIILPGHNVPKVEKIVRSEKKFIVVEKYMDAPKKVRKANKTDLDNN